MGRTKSAENGYQNMQNISIDNTRAKAAGISYGKYKANIRDDYEPSEYAVYEKPYLMPTRR